MTLREACDYVASKGVDISKQGLYSAALTFCFVSYKDGRLDYDEEGVKEFVMFKTDTHPEYTRLRFTKYHGTSTTILAKLLKAGIKYHRYSMYYMISRKDKNHAEQVLAY